MRQNQQEKIRNYYNRYAAKQLIFNKENIHMTGINIKSGEFRFMGDRLKVAVLAATMKSAQVIAYIQDHQMNALEERNHVGTLHLEFQPKSTQQLFSLNQLSKVHSKKSKSEYGDNVFILDLQFKTSSPNEYIELLARNFRQYS